MVHMRTNAVRVVGRYRQDLGDIAALAKSVARTGLLNPITVTSDGQLIAGQRRLEACRSLGWDLIPCIIADDLDTATTRMKAERDENTERKPMTPQELVALGAALEELERPNAKRRQGRGSSGHVTGTATEPGETRQKVASALGISPATYRRAKAVVAAAHDETLDAADQEMAKQALAEMNATGNVGGSYDKIRKVRDIRVGARVATVIADVKTQRRAINGAIDSLSGISYGLKQIGDLHPDIGKEEAAQWVGGLSEARRVLESLIKRLKERSNA